ncbi:MAG TPA: response regulator [Pyrinomonadaceae bacterium]
MIEETFAGLESLSIDTRDLVTMILEMAGHDVVCAATGETGIAALENLRPDVILMDMSLSGKLNGLDIVKKLRADSGFDTAPIVALTAHAMPQDHINSLAVGCDEHITKPILDLEFAETVSLYAEKGRNADRKTAVQNR